MCIFLICWWYLSMNSPPPSTHLRLQSCWYSNITTKAAGFASQYRANWTVLLLGRWMWVNWAAAKAGSMTGNSQCATNQRRFQVLHCSTSKEQNLDGRRLQSKPKQTAVQRCSHDTHTQNYVSTKDSWLNEFNTNKWTHEQSYILLVC